MRIEYDPNLVEQSVFLAVRKDHKLSADLHRATDPLYEIENKQNRQVRFQEVYITFFLRLGFDEVISRMLAERKIIEESIDQCLVCEATRHKEEVAELYMNSPANSPSENTWTLFIKVCPQSFQESSTFTQRLRRELLHVADMLDERFGYRKDTLLGHHPRQNLLRDRFKVLWDITVEGRLSREGYGDDQWTQVLRRQLEHVFPKHAGDQYSSVFERIFTAAPLRHKQLLAWASTPVHLFDEKHLPRRDKDPVPGDMCPICGFSTYDWFDDKNALYEVRSVVQKDNPQWKSDQGICRQCGEIYIAIDRYSMRSSDLPMAVGL